MPTRPAGTSLRSGAHFFGSGALVLVGMLAVVLSSTARADNQVPNPGSSGVSQYAELVPTASGPSAPGVGKATQASLPKKTKRELGQRGGTAAATLKTVATSSSYGAPTGESKKSAPSVNEPTASQTLRSVATALGSASETRLLGLLIALGTITVGAVVLGLRRPRGY